MIEKRIYKNYKRDNKWMGIIDYKTLVIIVIYVIVLFSVIKVLNFNLKVSFYLFILFLLPVFVLISFNSKNISVIDLIFVIIKFFYSKRIYIKSKYYCEDECIYLKNYDENLKNNKLKN